MPALAVTEHGNMFSSVVFHDHARERGLKPILGLRGLRRAGQPVREERAADRDEPPGAAGRDRRRLQEPDQAGVGRLHRRVLLPAAHRQGAAGAAREGPHRPEQLPQGRGRERAEGRAGAAGARSGGAAARHPRPEQLLPRDAVPGHRGAEGRQPRHRPAGARARTCRSSRPTTCTTCGRATTSRTTSCSASAPARRSTTRSACATPAISSS